MKIFLILTVISPFLSSGVFGQTPEKKEYTAARISTPPVINGILDDDIWRSGTWIDDFTQNEPYNGKKASQRTEFKILFDDNNLFVAIKAYDTSPDSIINRLSRRDQADGDLDLFKDMGVLFDKGDNKPHNVFLIKFSYRFGLK